VSLLLIFICGFLIKLADHTKSRDAIHKEELENDILFKYYHLLENDRARTLNTFRKRKQLIEETCNRYSDPFRVEQRGLHKTYPPLQHFSYFNFHGGKNHLTCNLLKVGSNSWKIFTKSLKQEMEKQGTPFVTGDFATMGHKITSNSSQEIITDQCWPNCAASSENIIVVRHPLERILSAYRHVFERNHGYEDEYIIVPSMREFLGDKFKQMSWPQFVDMIIDNTLDQHSELVNLKKASQTIGSTGETLNFVRHSDQKPKAKEGFSINEPDIWVSNHWAPYWFSCGLCIPELRPKYVLHMDHIDTDSLSLLKTLTGKDFNISFPHTLLGQDGHTKEHNLEYYKQLTKYQVWKLYNIYRVDHELFGYSPTSFINIAQ